MFNELQKKDYIEIAKERNGNIANIEKMFEKSKEVEEKLGKDLCEFSVKDILTLYRSFFTPSYYYLNNVNSQFRIYTAWCLGNNLVPDGQNHYEEITKALIESCINQNLKKAKVITRQELLSVLNKAVNTRDKFLFLGMFEGIIDNALVSLRTCTMDNFDLENMEFIMKDGKRIPISKELVEFARQSVEEEVYYAYNKDLQFKFRESKNNYILKGIFNSNEEFFGYSSARNIKNWYEKNMGYYFLEATALKESGRIDLIKRFAAKDGTSPMEAIRNHYNEIANVYKNFNPEDIYNRYKEFLED